MPENGIEQVKEYSDEEETLYFGVRITDIPSEEGLRPLTWNWPSKRTLRFFLLVALLLVTLSIILSRDTTPTVTLLNTDHSRQFVATSSLLEIRNTDKKELALGWGYADKGQITWQAAPAPANCPASPNIGTMHTIGGFPVWIFGFDGPNET